MFEAGFATVGFFPSREHGTYTALGETVNLAARLCSRAEANTIAVTKTFLTSLDLKEGTVAIGGRTSMTDIKGFEGEHFDAKVAATFVNGELAWDGSRVVGRPNGMRLRYAR